MTGVVGSSLVIFLTLFFNLQTDLCKLKFTGFMKQSCLIKNNNAKVFYYAPYSLKLMRICLVMRNQNIHKTCKHTFRKIVK